VFQKPLALGADIVVYSATKHIDGSGRVLAGAILASQAIIDEHYKDLLRHTGPALSPFSAWVCLKGLETLDLRVRAESASAWKLAELAEAHPKVKRAFYPMLKSHPQYDVAQRLMTGGGSIFAFDVGGREAAWRVLDALQIVDISNNIGDSKSLAVHPFTTTHRSMTDEQRLEVGVTDGCIRLSVGLEGLADLSRDLSRALDKA
jgi:O-succinylhomoserine sulfhydrylase